MRLRVLLHGLEARQFLSLTSTMATEAKFADDPSRKAERCRDAPPSDAAPSVDKFNRLFDHNRATFLRLTRDALR